MDSPRAAAPASEPTTPVAMSRYQELLDAEARAERAEAALREHLPPCPSASATYPNRKCGDRGGCQGTPCVRCKTLAALDAAAPAAPDLRGLLREVVEMTKDYWVIMWGWQDWLTRARAALDAGEVAP